FDLNLDDPQPFHAQQRGRSILLHSARDLLLIMSLPRSMIFRITGTFPLPGPRHAEASPRTRPRLPSVASAAAPTTRRRYVTNLQTLTVPNQLHIPAKLEEPPIS